MIYNNKPITVQQAKYILAQSGIDMTIPREMKLWRKLFAAVGVFPPNHLHQAKLFIHESINFIPYE